MKKLFSLILGATLITSTLGMGLWAQSYTLPQANFIISPAIGEASTPFVFDASDSVSGNGQSTNLEYRWQFRSGRDWTKFSGSSKITYIPWDDGTFRAKLQIRDRKTGQTQTTYRTYRARSHFPRRANLYADPINPKAGQSVHFWVDVFKVRNEDIDRIKVRWDFDGDGQWDTPFKANKEAWYAFGYNQIQRISPRAEVKYADGTVQSVRGIRPADNTQSRKRTADRTHNFGKIKITKPSVVAPILDIGPGSYGPHPQTQFTFDAKASKIPRGGWVEWSFDGDGFQKGPLFIRKIFEASGKHTVEVRTCVGFSTSECATTKASFSVKAPKTNFWVQSRVHTQGDSGSIFTRVNENYYQGFIGQTVSLSATTHTAGNKSVPSPQYRWDFDGDGVFDTGTSSLSRQTYTFQKTGRFRPTVEAISAQGVRAQSTLVIDIAANTAPQGSITLSKNNITVGESLTVKADISDRESRYNDIKVRFDLDGDGQWDGDFTSLRTLTWRYNKPGKYNIRVQARDGQGKLFTESSTVIVQSNPLLTHEPNESGSGHNTEERNHSNNGSSNNTGSHNTGSKAHQRGKHTRPSGERNLRIPIAPPQLAIHKDFKEYAEYATGWDNTYTGPNAIEPWLSNEERKTENGKQDIGNQEQKGGTNKESPYQEVQKPTSNGGNPSKRTASKNWNTPFGDNNHVEQSQNQHSSSFAIPKKNTGTQKSLTNTPQSSLLQKLQKKYQNVAIAPPYPGENPFKDVRPSDSYYKIAVQSYRDGLTVGPYFFR